ncbi:Uncharacterised protein [Vibrio cholerae]|nr:Uncharacterised protein [Vibrio cholerae]
MITSFLKGMFMWNMSIIKTCQYPLVTLFVLNNGISMRLF